MNTTKRGNGESAGVLQDVRLFDLGTDGQRPNGARMEPLGVEPSASLAAAQPEPILRASSVAIAQVETVLANHRGLLEAIPGVLDVRRGYKVTDGWITSTPCIVVTVRRKTGAPPIAVPERIEDVLVDVTPATPRQQLLAMSAEARRGTTLSHGLETEEIVRTSRYEPPPHLSLDPVEDAMTLRLHTSPDAGWPTLREFFQGITQRVTIGMYDFTAPHVREQLAASMKGVRGALRIVLDPKLALASPGEGDNPKAGDETEDQVRDELAEALGDRLQFTWAAVKLEGKTTKGIFPSAYHIKVAVRDGLSFWLSSGNWQSSNQPDLDPLGADAATPRILETYNREWHVVVSHRGLAQVFEQYLEWDIEQATPLQVSPELGVLPDLIAPAAREEAEAAEAPRYFPPLTLTYTRERPLRVQPLLSPDNYAEHALALLKRARRRLYIQNQYIKIAKQNADEFTALLDAIKGAMHDGVDVKIIVRDLPDVRAQLEALQDYGFDMRCVKTLRNTHTKGVIVDSSVVMVGSHNWSNDGVLYNRDASLILYDARAAKFYEDIFLYDWTRARHRMTYETAMPVIADAEEGAPAGHTTVRWADVYDG